MSKQPVPVGTRLTEEEREVVALNMGLCGMVADFKEFKRARLPFHDRVQAGMLGLARAVQLFDPAQGCAFSTYATPHIRQAIQRAVHGARLIHTPLFQAASNRFKAEAAEVKAVASIEGFATDPAVCYDDPAEAVAERDEARHAVDAVRRAAKSLNFRDFDIVMSRLCDEETLMVVGRRHGVSRERIRQLQDEAVDKLRRHPALAPYAMGA